MALAKKGVIGIQNVLTFLWYTDGAAVFKSGKRRVWLLKLAINELPFDERFCKENFLVPTIWCGPVKPQPLILAKPGMGSLRSLAKGADIPIFRGIMKKIKGVVLAGTGDTPARALMLNMIAHNGQLYACPKCEQKGESRTDCAGVTVFPYRPNEMLIRTKESFERNGKIAQNMKFTEAYKELKGTSPLSKIMPDPVKGTSIDAMHLVYGSVSKTILKVFVDKTLARCKCNVSKSQKSLVDERLLALKVPPFLTRIPMTTTDLALWKTSLLKSLCLYFALAVLNDIGPTRST